MGERYLMDADKNNCFWLDRTLLMCMLYCAVQGNKQHFVATLAALILHDFLVFMLKLLLHDLYALLSTHLNNLKSTTFNQSGIDNSLRGKGTLELCTKVKEDKKDGQGEGKKVAACENCRGLQEEEALKAKEKYKDKYKKKLLQKEERFEKVKSSLKDQHNEDRDKWEEDRKLLNKKYQEMRWT
ncbi:uncharacterized protein LOC120134137 [Hibiscus syriacus]|uniref:uncharacterized protein LOC120134137 n=1 Tax=Hibiscus syriacus TaxID=106335 RepID=UPI0019212A47|nr:uncharacterized protein LOC120134137 [Hibiscus syriacus]